MRELSGRRQRVYRLESEPFEEIGAWVDSFEQLWETRLDVVEAGQVGGEVGDGAPWSPS